MSPSPVHPAVSGFETAAAEYERGRPGYPPEAVSWIVETFELSETSTVVDLAAGTGKLARTLVPSGAQIIAIEPLPQMISQLARLGLEITELGAVAEAIPLRDDSVDVVLVANAWHWFDGDQAVRDSSSAAAPRAACHHL
jgi:SAM-dependent methyltransferase